MRKPMMAKTSASLAASGTPSSSVRLILTPGSRGLQLGHEGQVAGAAAGHDELADSNGRRAAATISAVATVSDASRSSGAVETVPAIETGSSRSRG